MKYTTILFVILSVTTFLAPAHLSALGSREGIVGDVAVSDVHQIEIRAHGFDVVVLATGEETTRVELRGASDEYKLHHVLRDGVLEAWTVGRSLGFTVAPEGRVHVEVPAESSVAVRTSTGAVTVSGLSGSVAVHTSTGDVRLADLVASFEIETASGSIHGSGIRVTGDSTIESSSGDVEMDLENELDELSFRLESSSGRLLVGRTQGRRELNLIGPGPTIVGDTTTGSQHYY